MKRVIYVLIPAAVGVLGGCIPVPLRDASRPREESIIGWRLVNRPYKDLEKLQVAGDARIPAVAPALVFEPIHADDEEACDASEFVRIEVIAGENAHVGEVVTARISIPNADDDSKHVVEI